MCAPYEFAERFVRRRPRRKPRVKLVRARVALLDLALPRHALRELPCAPGAVVFHTPPRPVLVHSKAHFKLL